MNQDISVGPTPYSCWTSPLMKTPAVELYWGSPTRSPRRSAGWLISASGRTQIQSCRNISESITGMATNGHLSRAFKIT